VFRNLAGQMMLLLFAAGHAVADPANQQPPLPHAKLHDAGNKSTLHEAGIDWCQTQRVYDKRNPGWDKDASCFEGPCDATATRNASIPNASTSVKIIRIAFHIFREDDGSNPAVSELAVAQQMDQLNADYAPSHIQFVETIEFINDSDFRIFDDTEELTMKNLYADSPATTLNIYVATVTGGYLGVGTFPWDAQALGNLGGIIMHNVAFGDEARTLTHEVGHCLGLWHTHHGVTEMSGCTVCYERANGANGETTGDLCADTAPTPMNFDCEPPGGVDSCSATSWGPTDPQNYMGYAPDSCYTEFSPQQMGRMHCWSGSVLNGWIVPAGTGVLRLTRTKYSCSNAVSVELTDDDLAGSGTAAVAVSTDGGDAENLTLSEVPGLPGHFRGTIPMSATAGADNNGTLNAVASTTIIANYNDASTAANVPGTSTDTAQLDCTAPIISNVRVGYAGAYAAEIRFDTSEVSEGRAAIGATCGTATDNVESAISDRHSAVFTGLTPSTSYRFKVSATDDGGNEASDDAGGNCYVFSTAATEDYLSEAFTSTPDLTGRSITFIPNGSPSGYAVCTELNTALPTSTTTATLTPLDDDDSFPVTLADGKTIPFFGADYSQLWINSNGNITFDAGDNNPMASVSAHFSMPRVSAMFVDLDPSSAGTVHRQQLSDRYVVTFTNVPEWSENDATTMQTELYFDGTIRISYRGIQADFGMAGLSRGVNLAAVFDSSDLSAYVDCDSLTPVVAPRITGNNWAEELTTHTLTIVSEGLTPPLQYSWVRSGQPLGNDSDTLTIPIVTQADRGTYRATVTDASKQIYQTPPFVLSVAPPNQLPIFGGAGIVLLMAVLAYFGIGKKK